MFTESKKIFLDSSVFIAFIDRGSQVHLKASKALEHLASTGCRLYTSSHSVIDSYNPLTSNVGTTVALEFLQSMLQTGIEVLFPQKADLITAHRILRINRDKEIPLSEALNAVLMQKKGIRQILTFKDWTKLFGTEISNLVTIQQSRNE